VFAPRGGQGLDEQRNGTALLINVAREFTESEVYSISPVHAERRLKDLIEDKEM
jgi:hypothetical protein